MTSVLSQLASALERRDEEPNIALAKQIAASNDQAAIKELVDALGGKNKDVVNDSIKVLYEAGGINPSLIAPYADAFIDMLKSKNNRLVWGAMTALGTLAPVNADACTRRRDEIIKATETGSAITQDWGVRVLAAVAAAGDKPSFAFLMKFLSTCRPKDVPRHAESALPAITAANRAEFVAVLDKRKTVFKKSELSRVEKVIKRANSL